MVRILCALGIVRAYIKRTPSRFVSKPVFVRADYSKMFELTDNLGRKLFESISITLVCGTPTLRCPCFAALVRWKPCQALFDYSFVRRRMHENGPAGEVRVSHIEPLSGAMPGTERHSP